MNISNRKALILWHTWSFPVSLLTVMAKIWWASIGLDTSITLGTKRWVEKKCQNKEVLSKHKSVKDKKQERIPSLSKSAASICSKTSAASLVSATTCSTVNPLSERNIKMFSGIPKEMSIIRKKFSIIPSNLPVCLFIVIESLCWRLVGAEMILISEKINH